MRCSVVREGRERSRRWASFGKPNEDGEGRVSSDLLFGTNVEDCKLLEEKEEVFGG